MAGSASFNNLGAMSSGPADLFGLMAFNLRRTESSQMVISVTEGTEQPMRSLWCGKISISSSKSSADIGKEIIDLVRLFYVVDGKASIFPL